MEEAVAGYLTAANTKRIAALLRNGGVAVLPTDTIYGFHCIATDMDALARIMDLKGDRREKGFILLASDLRMIDSIVSRWPGEAREILSRIWPAPLTALLPASKKLPAALSPGGVFAVRIPRHRMLRSLIRKTGYPLVSTSVNRAGAVPINKIECIRETFKGLDAYISRRGGVGNKPSTVIDFCARPPVLIRPGRHPWRR